MDPNQDNIITESADENFPQTSISTTVSSYDGSDDETSENLNNLAKLYTVIGNITNFNGPVQIMVNQKFQDDIVNNITETKNKSEDNSQDFHRHALIKGLRLLERRYWLAQPPLATEVLENPVEYAIICHTATESSRNRAGNIFHVRHIQLYHIESNGWNDIGYNFLIGDDGIVYEGRGWKCKGSHTFGYNCKSLGIAFIGTFNSVLPSEQSLKACRLLLNYASQSGYLQENYKLVGHCQIIGRLSPGSALYSEIQKWPNWSID
ncbi:peptidoglycan recognition protein-like [Ctenocephalides felis]|uniref:peptidoglycan recognition protein-like n=1 Tax=Ctenocephalides felis TaxID=7515 RepID=UPI000E6E588C|nr:peptidoglycan recognition protein-like [Ctenocephalides felis]